VLYSTFVSSSISPSIRFSLDLGEMISHLEKERESGVFVHTCNPSTQEAKAEESRV
jgi:hypothetical protein